MKESFLITAVLFTVAAVGGFIVLKYLEKRLDLAYMESENEEEIVVSSPPPFNTMDDIDYIVDWFIRRDKKIDNSLLLRMSIVENLVEETVVEMDTMMSKRYRFNNYLGYLVDFLPRIEQAEQVLAEYYRNQAGEDSKVYKLFNIRSYVMAKIRILGWLYYRLYGKWYNQRESSLLDFTEYFLSEACEQEKDSRSDAE